MPIVSQNPEMALTTLLKRHYPDRSLRRFRSASKTEPVPRCGFLLADKPRNVGRTALAVNWVSSPVPRLPPSVLHPEHAQPVAGPDHCGAGDTGAQNAEECPVAAPEPPAIPA